VRNNEMRIFRNSQFFLKGLFGSIEKDGRGGIYYVDKITLIFLLKSKIILVGILKF
jgi:hypothetical protein